MLVASVKIFCSRVFVLFSFLVLVLACQGKEYQYVDLSLTRGSSTIVDGLQVEVADDNNERMKGLMYRQSLPENNGMLFIFEKEEIRKFWMKNTYISLDIIYFDSNKKLVSIVHSAKSRRTKSLLSKEPALYVLEVNAGLAKEWGLQPGDSFELSK